MTNHLAEQTHPDGRKENEDKGSDDDPNTGTDSPATQAPKAPILQSEDDGLFDEDALE